MEFNVGDVVTLKNGKKPLTILEIYNSNGKVRMRYNHSSTEKMDYITNILMYEAAKIEKIQYSTKSPATGEMVKCNLVGKTSLGQYILEVVDTLEVLFVDEADAEEIVNFTFSTLSISMDYNHTRKNTSYIIGETPVETGDVLIDNNGILHRVTAVNTKDRNVKTRFKGVKLASVKM
jgi:uncharacterized protein YodC (DUF2158 family)